MKPIYKSLELAAMALQISLALNAETRDDESASTMALQADLLDSLRVELVALNVSGARDLIASGECVKDGSNLTITLDTSKWTRGAMYRVRVLATFGTQTQVIYALNITVPYYVALSDVPQEFSDSITIVSTITDVTEADLEGLALEETSQEIKAAIIPISTAAEAYNVGKTQLAAAISSKGVETSPTESYPEMAEKVNAIAQETYEINGGEMYAKQLFGSLETPNYWNLYDVLVQLLSDGRLINYGGILLAEYYRGYDSLALAGAGAGGAYVVSDKDENGQFKMYTEDTTHTWATEFDGKGNRWVAYCFADEGHDFEITNTSTSPRSIHIGRSVGNIRNLASSRCDTIVVTDGNSINSIVANGYTQSWNKKCVVRGVKNQTVPFTYGNHGFISIYFQADKLDGDLTRFFTSGVSTDSSLSSVILDIKELTNKARFVYQTESGMSGDYFNALSYFAVCNTEKCGAYFKLSMQGTGAYAKETIKYPLLSSINVIKSNEFKYYIRPSSNTVFPLLKKIYLDHTGHNDKTKTFLILAEDIQWLFIDDVELMDGFCKQLTVSSLTGLTEANMYAHILQRLKQDEPDCGDGVTITLGSTNLAKLTSEESVQLLDDLTNIYGYTFA